MPVAIRSKSNPMYDDQTCSTYPSSLTREQLESAVKLEWLDLYNHSKLCGAKALRQHLQSIGIVNLPSESTIGRIMAKQCLTNGAGSYHHPWNWGEDFKWAYVQKIIPVGTWKHRFAAGAPLYPPPSAAFRFAQGRAPLHTSGDVLETAVSDPHVHLQPPEKTLEKLPEAVTFCILLKPSNVIVVTPQE